MTYKKHMLIANIIVVLLIYPLKSTSSELVDNFPELSDAGVLLMDTHGQAVVSSQAQSAFIPASTTKLVTAWLALNHWGEDYHFQTNFYFEHVTKTLWVQGSGDPFLVSEEIVVIAANLKSLGLKEVDRIALDVSLFQPDLKVPGASLTNNPYDAVPTAIAANFNTVSIKKVAGKIVSAESQTPLTDFAKQLASQQSLSKRTLRINSGPYSHDAERYFAELLAVFLRNQGISVGEEVTWGKAPEQRAYYTHVNSKSLAEIIRPMMKYSTNFIANQLVLMLSAECYQRPANFADVQIYMEESLLRKFNWKGVSLKEGAGLSRENQLSPEQLVQLLEVFRPWKHLLPEVTPGVYAKSGTLNKVSTLAGYVLDNSSQQWNAFALMIKQSISHRRRNQIASELATNNIN